MVKEDFIGLKVDPEFKKQLRSSAEKLNLTMSELVRTAVDSYIDKRIHDATSNMLCRILHYLKETDSDFTLETAQPKAEKVMDGIPLIGMETWGGPSTPDEMFAQFVEMRLSSAERKESVTA